MSSSARKRGNVFILSAFLICLLPFALLFCGLYFPTKFGIYYYAFLVSFATMARFASLAAKKDADGRCIPMALRIPVGVLLCAGVIGMGIVLDYGVFNIIVSVAFSIGGFVVGTVLGDGDESILIKIRGWALLFLVVGIFAGVELWLPLMLQKSAWHLLWVGVLLMLGAVNLGAFSFFSEKDEHAIAAWIGGGTLAVFTFVRMMGVLRSIYPEGKGGVITLFVLICIAIVAINIVTTVMEKLS